MDGRHRTHKLTHTPEAGGEGGDGWRTAREVRGGVIEQQRFGESGIQNRKKVRMRKPESTKDQL